MKTLKGIGIYILILFGLLAVIAMLLIGCMFLMPGFKLFGWALLAKNHEVRNFYSDESYMFDKKGASGKTYDVTIDASVHNVYVTLLNDPTTHRVYVTQSDEMYGLYRPDELVGSLKASVAITEVNGANDKIDIKAPKLNSLISARNSSINVYLPQESKDYNLKITTTSGNISIKGIDKKDFSLNELEINTDSGNITFDKLRSKMYYSVNLDTDDKNFDGVIDSSDDRNGDGVIDVKDENQYLHVKKDPNGFLCNKNGIAVELFDTSMENASVHLVLNRDGKIAFYGGSSDFDGKTVESVTDENTIKKLSSSKDKKVEVKSAAEIIALVPTDEDRVSDKDRNGDGKYDGDDANGAFSANISGIPSGANRNFYYRIVPLKKVKISSNSGDVDFRFASSNVKSENEIFVTRSYDEVNFGNLSELNGILNATTGYTDMVLNIKRGNVNLGELYTNSFSLIGNDVLLKSSGIHTVTDFRFNSASGLFDIGKLTSKLSVITTNNIDIKLKETKGELSITTEYGNISIGKTVENVRLNTVHGNITVNNATGSISAISEFGDINVKYGRKAYFKNNHGSTTVEFHKNDGAAVNDDQYNQTCDIVTGDGVVSAKNLTYETTITSNGGRVNAQFSEMYEASDVKKAIKHKIILNSGSVEVSVPNLKAFMFKGTGAISGSVGTATMAANNDFTVVIGEEANAKLAHLEVDARGGSVTFNTYWNV